VARIRPDVESLGGRLEVVTAAGGVVNIQLSAGGDDPSASSAMLRELVEEALRAELPEFVRLDLSPPTRKPVAPLEPTPVVIPLSALTRRRRASSSPEASASSDLGPSSQR
ncbi:MAG: NifU family protein, partial [Actinomycetota bacterium]|nr:NifU family protein [Actinomycetota bacterium]